VLGIQNQNQVLSCIFGGFQNVGENRLLHPGLKPWTAKWVEELEAPPAAFYSDRHWTRGNPQGLKAASWLSCLSI
jgi:hypothetical protein